MKKILFSISILSCFVITLVAAATVKPAPGFECTGTEPFWSLTINGSKSIRFSSPEIKQEFFVPVTPINPEGDMAYVYNTTSKISKGTVVVTILKASCSDSMSETEYDYTVIVDRIKEKYAMYGCCKASR